ncbi:glycosyltransferase [Photobacterium damselae]|uniref:glycosyltransferase n=1 Tax=Photobacterium damselae TaxID=38293 RepID=UPI00189FD2CB|nr:glycosyltransferase [Photobacterium damselae]
MKILQVSKLYPPYMGGIETVVYDITTELKNFHKQVDVLSFSEDSTSKIEEYDGSTIFRCSSLLKVASTYLSLSYIYRWMIIRNNYDLIHIHVPNPIALLAMYLFPTNAKVVIHWHSDIVKQKKLKILFNFIQKSCLIKAHSIVTTSELYAKESQDLKPFIDKVTVIPIGIDKDKLVVNDILYNELSNKFNNKKIIFSLGRHVYYKGFEYLIEASKNLPDNYVVLIGGGGPLTATYKEMIKKYALENKVFLIGRVSDNDLGTYYQISSVFCLPSVDKSEAFGVVQLEAMSFGTPIVSCNIKGSGVPWVNSFSTGIVCEPKDAKMLAKAIFDVTNSNLFTRDSIKDVFTNKFTKESMSHLINKLYISLCDKKL